MPNKSGYVRLSDESIRRKDSPPHPRLSVVNSDHKLPEVVHPPLDLDYTRAHRLGVHQEKVRRRAWLRQVLSTFGTR